MELRRKGGTGQQSAGAGIHAGLPHRLLAVTAGCRHCSAMVSDVFLIWCIATRMRSSIIEYSPSTTTTTPTLDVRFIASRAAPAKQQRQQSAFSSHGTLTCSKPF